MSADNVIIVFDCSRTKYAYVWFLCLNDLFTETAGKFANIHISWPNTTTETGQFNISIDIERKFL